MHQQISVIILGVAALARSRQFHVDGFGWTPVFESPEIIFYQMNGFVFGAPDTRPKPGSSARAADAPPYGGLRGYVADPDEHAWEIAWNPAWPISPEGYVRFSSSDHVAR